MLEGTNRNLDVAITGDGFFQVLLPDGTTGYTRDGHFQIDANGKLTTTSGLPIQPEITLPQDMLNLGIGKDGQFTVTTASSPDTATPLTQLQTVRFVNPSGLSPRGGNVFMATAASGVPIVGTPGESGLGELQQNFLERSNVEVVSELVNLIVAQRAYEVNSRSIRVSDELLVQALAIIR